MAADRILDRLNDTQREAVTHAAAPLLTIAGAGTGKTTVITRRIAWLIAQKKARPEEILALTFTDKAAAEMEERVDTLVPYGYADVEIATFHAFGDRLLREHALELGLQPDFRVLNRAEQVIFLRDRLFQLPLERYRPLGDPTRHIQALITLISRCKDEDIACEEYLAFAERLATLARATPEDAALRERAAQQLELARTYAKYQELMAASGAIDFGDQIVHALRLLRSRPYVLAGLQRRFKHILVDEFQDTNWAEFEIVKLLGARHANVAAVGDDNQAIYRWRGAALSNFRGFRRHFQQATVVVLTENYRSPHRILDPAYRLILNNPDRLEESDEGRRYGVTKKLSAVRAPDGPEPRHLHYETATQEADEVARLVQERVAEGAWKYDDVAVLVRSNADAEQFLRSLNLRGIPWTFSGNAGLYGRPEIRLLIAFLRAVAHPDDSVSVHYLASSDLYQVPIADLTRCSTYADRRHRWLFDVFRTVEAIRELRDEVGAEGREAIRRLVVDLTRYMELAREMPTGELLYQFLVDSGWLARMSKAATARDEAEVQNISKFFRRVQDASKTLRYDNVREFVNHLDALIDAGEDPAVAEAEVETPAVRILTVHKAKGLEFPVVVLVALVQDKFPLRGRRDALELPVELIKETLPSGDFHKQEERRLFYVGMTRAERELYLTSARDYGGTRERKGSRVVEYYLLRRAAGNYTSVEDLLAVYEREWDNQGFLTWEHEEARKAAGRQALTRFWHEEEAGGQKPTYVEKEFGFSLGRDRVRGRFDRVDEDLLGATIIDYKTGEVAKQKVADRRAAESLQLKLYALAWREMTGALPQRVELHFLESNLVGRHTPAEADTEEAIAAVHAAAAGIRARAFEATPSYNACRHCAYNQICPYTATRE